MKTEIKLERSLTPKNSKDQHQIQIMLYCCRGMCGLTRKTHSANWTKKYLYIIWVLLVKDSLEKWKIVIHVLITCALFLSLLSDPEVGIYEKVRS